MPDAETWISCIVHKSPGLLTGRKIIYTVRFTSKDGTQQFLKAPAHQVARRFPEGCSVEVYRDALRGWELATVLTALPVELASSSSNSSGDRELKKEQGTLWDTVPVCLTNSANQGPYVSHADLVGPYVRVPVYLVRPCKSSRAICHLQI